MSAPALVASTPRLVDVNAIERELAQLWSDPQLGDDSDAVTRACMSNLLVYCDCDDTAGKVSGGLAEIAERHPARVLLLVGGATGLSQPIEAYVSALCHRVSGGRQVCSEHVSIRSEGDGRRRLASVARSLIVGDLPTALWWAAGVAPPTLGDPFPELMTLARHLIYDSTAWPAQFEGLVAMARWFGQHKNTFLVADLSWRRLRAWRRALGETIDPAVAPGVLRGLREMTITFGNGGVPLAWLLAGWVSRSLDWRVENAQSLPDGRFQWSGPGPQGPVRWVLVPDAQHEGLVSARFRWQTAAGQGELELRASAPRTIEVTYDGDNAPRGVHSWAPLSTAELVALELPELGPDPTFTTAMLGVEAMLARLRAKG